MARALSLNAPNPQSCDSSQSPDSLTGSTLQRIDSKAAANSETAQSKSSISSRYSGQLHPEGHI